ncbi:hypothetical protein AMR72_02260 [Flavobacterium psychrophilum]|nr:hypothetical protein AMR72_02260 [Flavobacterium psychrophilum]AOE51449.1 hypothetical protein ALW18_02260 [Flavobacterium psychrophilum]
MKVEELKKYKDSLYTSLSRDLDAFEKNFILIASGLLAFSITFIKDIVKIEGALCLCLLFLGWLFILAAVGVMMYAFLSSVNGSNKLWKITDDFIIANTLYNPTTPLTINQATTIKNDINKEFYKIKNRLKWIRAIAVALFLIGVFSFGAFVSINLYKENNPNKTKSTDKSKSKTEIIVEKATITTSDSVIIKNPIVQPQVQTSSQPNRSNANSTR